MGKRIFTEEQIKELAKNRNVGNCSNKSITYNEAFKVLAIAKYYEEGYSPRIIFEEAGFNISVIGVDTPRDSLQRWRKIYKEKGAHLLRHEQRGKHNKDSRIKTKDVNDADRIKRLEIENAYLKAENDFLVKLRAAKKR